MNCVPRTVNGDYGTILEDYHEFAHIYDIIDEEYFPIAVNEDDDADIIEASKCQRNQKIYIKSICKYCGLEITR